MDKAIIVDHLFKENILKDISFALQRGELVGIIGSNSSGKKILLRSLCGLANSTSGFVSVLGYDPQMRSKEFLKTISFISGQKSQLIWNSTGRDSAELNKIIYNISEKDYEKNLIDLSSALGVSKLLDIPVRKLSANQQIKVDILANLIYSPKIVFFEEPMFGLDTATKKQIKEFIYEYNKKYETTIILTSNNMDDLSELTRRIIVIEDNRILFDGAFDEVTEKYASEKNINATLVSEINVNSLNEIGNVKKYVFPKVTLSVPRSTVSLAASELIQNFPIVDINIEEQSIEEIITRINKWLQNTLLNRY